MAHLIDKDALVAEIERRIKYDEMVMDHDAQITELLSRELNTLYELSSFIDTLEVKEVDLEKELIEWHKEHFKKDGTFIGMSGFYLTNNSQMGLVKHFFELGLKAKGE